VEFLENFKVGPAGSLNNVRRASVVLSLELRVLERGDSNRSDLEVDTTLDIPLDKSQMSSPDSSL
jgi:hypothetical protein